MSRDDNDGRPPRHMSTHDDEEALTWAGDRDRDTTNITWSTPKAGESPSSSNPGLRRRQSRRIETATNANAELIVTVLCAAVYLLSTVAWFIVALRDPIQIADPLGNGMFVAGLWLAVAAGPLWFGGVLLWGREFSLTRRITLLVVGAVVVIPWPYIVWAS